MIHSLAGGELAKNKVADLAKVKIIDGIYANKIFFYINELSKLKISDIVNVPVGTYNTKARAEVLKIYYNVSYDLSPVPFNRLKKIISKI